MAKVTEKPREKGQVPPSAILAFIVGIILFGLILCPSFVLVFFNLHLQRRFDITIMQSLTLGCFTGLVIAIVPALVFMRSAMKKIKKY